MVDFPTLGRPTIPQFKGILRFLTESLLFEHGGLRVPARASPGSQRTVSKVTSRAAQRASCRSDKKGRRNERNGRNVFATGPWRILCVRCALSVFLCLYLVPK